MHKKSSIDLNTVMTSSVHDMKNSLSLILNTIDHLCDDKDLPANRRDSLELLRREGTRLNNTFMQLLSLYRIENKQYVANIENYNVHDCLEELGLENEPLLSKHNLDLSIDCDEQLYWFFDRALILGTLNTILNNAFRYARRRVKVSANRVDAELVICILDDGEGYPEQMLCNQSERQADLNFHSGNTGLGLYFADVVAQLHQNKDRFGRIEISNAGINNGGKFAIYLP